MSGTDFERRASVELTTQIDEQGLGHLVLNRPSAMNSLTVEIAAGLGNAAQQLHADGARAIILRGEGATFCAGADLNLVREALAQNPHDVLEPLVRELHGSLKAWRSLPIAIIAAVEGPAVGAGFGLALAADLRVAAAGARFVPGYFGIGSSPDGGVSYHLARALGPARAQRLIMLNETITAARGESLGFVDEVVPDGEALAAATELGKRASNAPGQALVRTRSLVETAYSTPLAEQLDLEQTLVTELWDTHDFREGVTAFLERRAPRFTGN